MSLGDALNNLRQKPLAVRMRILWATTLLVAAALVVIWITVIQQQVGDIDSVDFGINRNQTAVAAQYTQIEWTEVNDAEVKIYFKVNNNTPNILDVPTNKDFKLTSEGKTAEAKVLNDRQGNIFVQKVLAHTEVYGVATFPKPTSDDVKLMIDQMFFESDPNYLFNETMDFNLEKLNKPPKLRE